MATQTGNKGVIKVGINTLAELKSWTFSEQAAQIPDTAMGDQNQTSKSGIPSANGTFEVHYDPTDTAGQQTLVAALRAGTDIQLVLQPQGDTSGDQTITMTAQVTGHDMAGGIDEILSRAFNYSLSTGQPVDGTVP